MWPGDLLAIRNMLKDLSTAKGFPAGSKPFIFQEVIDQGKSNFLPFLIPSIYI